MAIQYYKTKQGNYQLNKSTGVAQKINNIPQGGGVITWGGSNLPTQLQNALQNSPAPTAPAPVSNQVTDPTLLAFNNAINSGNIQKAKNMSTIPQSAPAYVAPTTKAVKLSTGEVVYTAPKQYANGNYTIKLGGKMYATNGKYMSPISYPVGNSFINLDKNPNPTPTPTPVTAPQTAPAVLTSQQQTDYFSSQGNATNPLSPADWVAQQATSPHVPPVSNPNTGTSSFSTGTIPLSQPAGQTVPTFLTDFNTAINNKDYGALKAMGAGSITSSSLTPSSQTNFQTTPTPSSIDGGGVPKVPTLPAPLPETAKTTETNALLKKIQGIIGETAGQAKAKTDAQTKFKVQEKQTQLQNIADRIQALDTQATQAKLKASDRLAPTFAITGEQNAIDRAKAIKMLGLNAQFQVAKGNLQLANDYVTKAVNAEFDPIKEKLNIAMQNLKIISMKPDATPKEKALAEKRKIEVQQTLNTISQQKRDKTSIQNLILEAVKKNASPATIVSLENASSLNQALQVMGQAGLYKPTDQYKVGRDAKGNTVQYTLDKNGKVTGQQILSYAPTKTTTKGATGISTTQLKQFINKQIATPAFQNLTPQEKTMYIRSQGADPYNFGF